MRWFIAIAFIVLVPVIAPLQTLAEQSTLPDPATAYHKAMAAKCTATYAGQADVVTYDAESGLCELHIIGPFKVLTVEAPPPEPVIARGTTPHITNARP